MWFSNSLDSRDVCWFGQAGAGLEWLRKQWATLEFRQGTGQAASAVDVYGDSRYWRGQGSFGVPDTWGLAAAVAHCVSLQAACREVQAVAGQRLFCVEFLDPGSGAGRSLLECTAAGGLW